MQFLKCLCSNCNSRVDIVQSAEIFKHPVTEIHIVTRLASEETILLFFQTKIQPRGAFTGLPSRIPIVP